MHNNCHLRLAEWVCLINILCGGSCTEVRLRSILTISPIPSPLTGVDDPGNAWRMFHDIKSSLAGYVNVTALLVLQCWIWGIYRAPSPRPSGW
jgi:hypothetical protein